jgi:hypothetical protein
LTALAGQAAIAILNSQLYEDAERRRQEAEELARIARSLTETLDMRAVGERVVASVLKLFGVRGPVSGCASPTVRWTVFVWTGEVFSPTDAGSVVPTGVGMAGRAFSEGKPVWSADEFSAERRRDPSIGSPRQHEKYLHFAMNFYRKYGTGETP